MSNGTLPLTIDLYKYIDQRRSLNGRIPLAACLQLKERLVEDAGFVDVVLDFGRDEQKQAIIEGKIEASVMMACERCGQELTQKVRSEWTSGVVSDDEQAKQLPRSYEPWLTTDEAFCLADFVGEELLLSLPMYTYHEDCGDALLYSTEQEELEESPAEKKSPFQALAVLKGDQQD